MIGLDQCAYQLQARPGVLRQKNLGRSFVRFSSVTTKSATAPEAAARPTPRAAKRVWTIIVFSIDGAPAEDDGTLPTRDGTERLRAESLNHPARVP